MPGTLYCANMGGASDISDVMLGDGPLIQQADIRSIYEAAQRIDSVYPQLMQTAELKIILPRDHVNGLVRDGIIRHFRDAAKKAEHSRLMDSLKETVECRKTEHGEKETYELEIYGNTETVLAILGAYIKQKYPNETPPLTHIAPQLIDELIPCRRV
ncbi:MAG: hypothetical protein IT567_02750 [Alphaproteobacteria bacterium]|nr:hypothetical protein [Alphaproteobacteria bacterium]